MGPAPLLLLLPVSFTHGVASGDVTPFSAVLWTRVDREAALTVEIFSEPELRTRVMAKTAAAIAERDFTVKIVVSPLEPGRTYYYRWTDGESSSEAGMLKTAPSPQTSVPLRFAFSGDSDGAIIHGTPAFNQFEALDAARRENLDFFVYLGDTVYADRSETLAQYRDAYKVNREMPALRDLMKATSLYAIWDDHEVRNDYAGAAVDRRLYTAGRQAFLEYMPLQELSFPDPLNCVADPLLRVFHWGKDVDIIILDERSCRSPSAGPACTFQDGIPDLAPTLPPLLRVAAGLAPAPPDGCIEAISDSRSTMLGRFQKIVFLSALLYSQARFKFVINEVAIQQFYAFPYDRWEGYAAERNEILRFIRANNIRNVIFLTADAHTNFINEVFIDRFRDPAPVAQEFVTGPIATNTLRRELESLSPLAPAALNGILDLVGMHCRNLDAYSYGLVEVDPSSGVASIMLKDDRGAVLRDQTNPTVECRKIIG